MAALVAAAALGAAPGARAQDELVRLSTSAPATALAGPPFGVDVTVAADGGAFQEALAPVRLRVRLSPPDCPSTFARARGPVVIDQRLALPSPATAPFTGTFHGTARASDPGTAALCEYVEEEGSNRLYAADGDTAIKITLTCPAARRRRAAAARALSRAQRTLRALRRRRAHTPAQRRRLRRKRRRQATRVRALRGRLGAAGRAERAACG